MHISNQLLQQGLKKDNNHQDFWLKSVASEQKTDHVMDDIGKGPDKWHCEERNAEQDNV